MYKNYRMLISIIFCSLFGWSMLTAQEFCGTPQNTLNKISPQDLKNYQTSSCSYTLRLYIHVVRRDDGTGGVSTTDINQSLSVLAADFNQHNIFFYWDNQIDHINSSLYYDTQESDVLNNLFTVNAHPDGIDIYYVKEVNTSSIGNAADIPSSAFWITGGYWHEKAMSHEMGHCLGLFHTHHGCESSGIWEWTDGSNCLDAGDFVCDTPTDPNLILEVNGNCVWSGKVFAGDCKDENQLPEPISALNPDVHNIMSFTNIVCSEYFSEGQAERMRVSIASSPILQQTLISDSPLIDFLTLSINQNTTWTANNTPNDGNIVIGNALVIEDGATLTIGDNVTVGFEQNAKLIIKPNARLILEGTLTSSQCSSFWKGVEVWGNNSKPQYTINGRRYQGSFVARAGSVIENAEIGVQLWGGGEMTASAGGQISCYKATFINNKIAVQFAPYENTYPFSFPVGQQGQARNYFGHFNQCDFIKNNAYSIPKPFHSFVHLTEVRGIPMYDCTFTRHRSYGDDVAYGIFANDAAFTVGSKYRDSAFEGLEYGIYATNIADNRPFTVSDAHFSKCSVGIYNNMISGCSILSNIFEIGEGPTEYFFGQFGVVLENNISGINIESNKFIGSESQVYTHTGTYCQELGSFNNRISGNTFDDLFIANFANGLNRGVSYTIEGRRESGLHYLCNDANNTIVFDFGVGSHGIRENQGLLVLNPQGVIEYDAAGNKFAYTGLVEDRDFSNEPAPILNYYYFDEQRQVPEAYSNINIIESFENTCPTVACTPPCQTPTDIGKLKNQFYTYQTKLNQLLDEKGGGEGEHGTLTQKELRINYYQQEMDKAAEMILMHSLIDTLRYHPDTIDLWLGNINTFGMDVAMAIKHQSKGNLTRAIQYVNKAKKREVSVVQQQDDLRLIDELLSVLQNKSPYHLEEADLVRLETLATYDNTIVGNVAQSILTYYGYFYPFEYKLPDTQKAAKNNAPEVAIPIRKAFSIAPNPNTGRFYVTWQALEQTDQPAFLTVMNAMGHRVATYPIAAHTQKQIQLPDAKTGVYFYQITLDGKIVESGKLLVQ